MPEFAILFGLLGVLGSAELEASCGSEVARFGLLIGYNGTENPANAPLAHADDDAIRAFELLGPMLCEREDAELVVEPDEATIATFGRALDVEAPTRAGLQGSVQRLAARIQRAQDQGRSAEVHVHYSGHGDIIDGLTHLTLSDGLLSAQAFFEEVIDPLGADRVHLVVDSCNAGYLLSARGAHRPTRLKSSAASIRKFAERRPHVGVVLSTAKADQSFEDPSLGAGLVSHVVLSGFSGAADANLDGTVSYGELRAFVDAAFAKVRPARYRAQVFVAPPGWKALDTPLWPLSGPPLVELEAPQVGHFLLVEQDRRIRHFDLPKAGGQPMRVHAPNQVGRKFRLERFEPATRISTALLALGIADEATRRVTVKQIEASNLRSRARGQAPFDGLFEAPYSPSVGTLQTAVDIEEAVPPAAFVWGPSLSVGAEQGTLEGVDVVPEVIELGLRPAFGPWSLDVRLGASFLRDQVNPTGFEFDYRRLELTLSPRYGIPLFRQGSFGLLAQVGLDVSAGIESQSAVEVPQVGPDGTQSTEQRSFDAFTSKTAAAVGALFILDRHLELAVEVELGPRWLSLREQGNTTLEARTALGGRVAAYWVLW